MSTTGWKYRSATVLAFGTALVLTGCGSGGDDADTASPLAATSAPSSAAVSAPAAPAAPTAAQTPSAGPSTPAAMPTGDPDEPATCTTGQLATVVEDTPGGGAAGSVYRTLVFTNISAEPCRTGGFAGVSYVDTAGAQIGAPAVRAEELSTGLYVLEPGQSAAAELRETRAQNYGDACEPQTAAGMLVFPPDDFTSVLVPRTTLACASGTVELLTISALQPR